MMKTIQWRPALTLFFLLTLLTGFVYPVIVTGLGTVFFPHEAAGSLIKDDSAEGKVVGSALIGQSFTDAAYFWGRPSATANQPYNALASGGSNLSPASPVLHQQIRERILRLQATNPDNPAAIPIDLITASASGLDPHISANAAYYQAGRIARERGQSVEQIHQLIGEYTQTPVWGILGEAQINVLALNRALDRQFPLVPSTENKVP